MILARRAALNGVYLDEVNDRIAIQAIEIADGKENISAVASAAGHGQRIAGARRDSLDVNIRFGIDIRRTDLQGRAAALEAVNTWASMATNGAYLTLDHKPGRRLRVHLEQAPGEGNLWEWTNDFSILFRAYEVPFWEDDSATRTDIGGVSSNVLGNIIIKGNAPTVADVELLNKSGMEIRRINQVNVNGYEMGFDNLGLMGDETLIIDHSESGLLRIRIRSVLGQFRSVMSKRTPDSDDDFVIQPGSTSAGFSSERACKMTVVWRCRYL